MTHTDRNSARHNSTFSVSIRPNVVHEDFDDEVIILNLNIGLYHALNETAGLIWSKIAEHDPPESIVVDVARKYDISDDLARSMVVNLIRVVEDEQLVDVNGAWPEVAAKPAGELLLADPPPFWPVVETYRDMHHALVLDPIHEVDESGWPTPKVQKATGGTE